MRFGPSRVCRVPVGKAFVQASAAFNWPQHGDRQWQAIRSYPTSAEIDASGSWSRWRRPISWPTRARSPAADPRARTGPCPNTSASSGLTRVFGRSPFAVVADDLAKSELKPEICNRQDGHREDIETYCQPPWERLSGKPNLILVVSVSGAPYADDQEGRRRRRYAVLAGLDAEGFVPEDAQHIGFYWPNQPRPSARATPRPLTGLCFNTVPPPALSATAQRGPAVVPYGIGSNRGPSIPMSKRNTGESCSSGSMRTFSLPRRSNRCRQTRSRQK